MTNNILITGASGFVGKNLINYLKNYQFQINTYNRKLEIDLRTVSTIVHLAGKAHDLKNVSVPQEYYDANFELTKKLYDQFLKSSAQKFIFISSVKASADKVVGILNESDEPNPQTHYGKSKLQAEEYITSQMLPEGKSYYILRPCMIHGPGNKGNLNLLYKVVSKGIPWPLASFENKRSFLSVENLCFVIKQLAESNSIDSGIYNVADDISISTNDLISIISRSLNKEPKLWRINARLIASIANLGDTLKLPLNSERLKKLTESYVVSNDKIKKAIGKNLPLSTHEGLSITLNSFKNA
jgi:nucleoside-diphosphate-sugar epimerase